MDEERHVRALQDLNAVDDPAALAERARSLHAADLASLLEEMDPARRHAIFACLDNASAAALLDELEPDLRAELLSPLSLDRASDIVEEMPADEAADLLNELPDARADAILGAMESDDAEDVRELLDYESDTAGGQMTTEFIAVDESLTVDETIRRLQELAPEAETVYYLYVLGDSDRLVGVVSLRSLIISRPDARVADIMSRDVISVSADADQEQAADLIARYNLVAVPVLDSEGRPIGIITVDDAVDVIDEETAEDIYELAGSGDESSHSDGLFAALRHRTARWSGMLAVSLAAGAMLGWVARSLAAPSSGISGAVNPARTPGGSTGSLALDVVAFLPAMLGLSWLLQSQAQASLFSRRGAGGRAGSIWIGTATDILASVGLALGCGVLAAVALYIFRPQDSVFAIVGFSLAAGLAISAVGAHVIPRLLIAWREGGAPSPAAAASISHAAGVLAYLGAAYLVARP